MRKLMVMVLLLVLLGGGLFAWQSWRVLQRSPRALPQASEVRVDKSEHRMQLRRDGQVIASYAISLGANPLGDKRREGDEKTPEGRYVLDWRNAGSRFFRSLHISYPNAADRARAAKAGVDPGGAIMIHGMPNGYAWAAPLLRYLDWTDGCIAVDNVAMREIWKAVPTGTPIVIQP